MIFNKYELTNEEQMRVQTACDRLRDARLEVE